MPCGRPLHARTDTPQRTLLRPTHLGRLVVWRTADGVRFPVMDRFCKAKVGHLEIARRIQEQVLRLEVSVSVGTGKCGTAAPLKEHHNV